MIKEIPNFRTCTSCGTCREYEMRKCQKYGRFVWAHGHVCDDWKARTAAPEKGDTNA